MPTASRLLMPWGHDHDDTAEPLHPSLYPFVIPLTSFPRLRTQRITIDENVLARSLVDMQDVMNQPCGKSCDVHPVSIKIQDGKPVEMNGRQAEVRTGTKLNG